MNLFDLNVKHGLDLIWCIFYLCIIYIFINLYTSFICQRKVFPLSKKVGGLNSHHKDLFYVNRKYSTFSNSVFKSQIAVRVWFKSGFLMFVGVLSPLCLSVGLPLVCPPEAGPGGGLRWATGDPCRLQPAPAAQPHGRRPVSLPSLPRHTPTRLTQPPDVDC